VKKAPVLLVAGSIMLAISLMNRDVTTPHGVVVGVNRQSPGVADLMLRQLNGETATVRVDGPRVRTCLLGTRYPDCTEG